MSIQKIKLEDKTKADDKDLLQTEKLAKELLVKDGALSPMLFVQTNNKGEDDKSIMFVCPLIGMTNENKQRIFYETGKEMDEKGMIIQKVMFVSESWCLVTDKKGIEKKEIDEFYKTHKTLEKHPNRTEAMTIVSWETKNNNRQMIVQPFSKDKAGKVKYGERVSMKAKDKLDAKFYLLEEFFKGYLVGNDPKDKINKGKK